MRDFSKIEVVLQDVCNCAVESLGRFCELTEFEPLAMHESFMASFVFDRLGQKHSMVPELMVSTIFEFDHSHIQPMPSLPLGIKPQRRIDLTLFDLPHAPKSKQELWCLVELKRYWSGVEKDYWKLKPLIQAFECPFGFAAGIVPGTQADTRQWLGEEAKKLGEHCVVSRQWDYKSDSAQRPYVVAGYLFERI